VWDKANLVAMESFDSILQDLKADPNRKLVLAADGAWAKRGWTSTQGK
jgi:hypothetical protein